MKNIILLLLQMVVIVLLINTINCTNKKGNTPIVLLPTNPNGPTTKGGCGKDILSDLVNPNCFSPQETQETQFSDQPIDNNSNGGGPEISITQYIVNYENLPYRCENQSVSFTRKNGEFDCPLNSRTEFFIDINGVKNKIGSISIQGKEDDCKDKKLYITPFMIANNIQIDCENRDISIIKDKTKNNYDNTSVYNVTRLLISLDNDWDNSNPVVLNKKMLNHLSQIELNFQMPEQNFEEDMKIKRVRLLGSKFQDVITKIITSENSTDNCKISLMDGWRNGSIPYNSVPGVPAHFTDDLFVNSPNCLANTPLSGEVINIVENNNYTAVSIYNEEMDKTVHLLHTQLYQSDDSRYIKEGDKVSQWTTIGKVSNNCITSCSKHLHIQLDKGKRTSPIAYTTLENGLNLTLPLQIISDIPVGK
ncbi:MAG: hypothetical protein KDK54_20505 [Leptospiraceae bacterium]|nr:hypothetical protein [Leptospiraceae bacterium]